MKPTFCGLFHIIIQITALHLSETVSNVSHIITYFEIYIRLIDENAINFQTNSFLFESFLNIFILFIGLDRKESLQLSFLRYEKQK